LVYIEPILSSIDGTKCMAKRKKTDIVQFKLRIREALRRRLEAAAGAEERSLNSEIAHRLENSFEQEKSLHMLEALLAPGPGLELVRAVGIILGNAGRDWNTPPKSDVVAEAIRKIVGLLSHELRPDENSFPNHKERDSADQLAWPAACAVRWHEVFREAAKRGRVRAHSEQIGEEAADNSDTVRSAGKMP
jgi:hypothetical protein